MPSNDSCIEESQKDFLQEFDLGLKIPQDFDLKPLFPEDRLLRLNPHWFITDFKKEHSLFSAEIEDYATREKFSLKGSIRYRDKASELMSLRLSGSLQQKIIFLEQDGILKAQIASSLNRIDDDDPLLLWIRGIREYIRLFLKLTPVTLFFRLLMNHMILKMNPSQRKISMMITKITAVEVLVIILIVVGYVIFVL